MSLLLHLADLHLGTVKDQDIHDDFKSDIVPLADRMSRQRMLKETLTELAKLLRGRNELLDAVIISGDITVANDEVGFQMLGELLESLGDRCPLPEKIVVVPGNHDVQWEIPGDPALRYALFTKYTREKGFITPLLEGIDLKAGNIVTADLSKHYLLDPNCDWAVIPINSSHYCGSVEPLTAIPEAVWSNLVEEITKNNAGLDKDAIAKDLRHLRLRDVARISDPDQMLAIKELSAAVRAKAGKDKHPLLIGVLHHQLLPVTLREELKPFESITNLGHLRSVLQDNNYSAVFHGHKHTDYCYFDYIHRMPDADVTSPHRVFVISGPSLAVPGARPEVVCRLVRTSGGQYAPAFSLQDVLSIETGKALELASPKFFRLWQPSSASPLKLSPLHVVQGNSVDEVYERTLALFEGRALALVPNVICRVAESSDPVSLPAAYPQMKGVPEAERSEWFKKIVDWWQKEEFKKLSGDRPFNHGLRIHLYERGVNQLNRVAEAIMHTCKTSRGVVTLLKPQIDELHDHSSRFPSFCLVQFVLRDQGNQYSLDVIAYFRKQEMRYWWPVNIAELSQLQRKIFDRIQNTVQDREKKTLALGVITTFAATAHLGTKVPYILVPAVDVDLEESPQKLWDMTYALCWDAMKDREKQVITWQHVLRDLTPPIGQDPAGVPVPIQGVEYLAEIAEHFARNHEGAVRIVALRWREVEGFNRDHARKMDIAKGDISPEVHNKWRSDVVGKLNEIRTVVNEVLGASLEELQ